MGDDRPVPYSPQQAAAMREAFALLRSWGVSSPELARRVGVGVRTIENFIKGGRSPSYKIWRLYYDYACRELATTTRPELVALLKDATNQHGNMGLLALAAIVPDSFQHTRDANAFYRGNYLTYRFAYIPNHISVGFLHVFCDPDRLAVRFEHRYRTRQQIPRSVIGYIIPTERTLNFIGSIDETGHLSMAIITRPAAPETSFSFLHGILLSVERGARQFAARIVIRPLPPQASLEEYDDKIRLTCISQERMEGESEDDLQKRREFIKETMAIKGLRASIENRTPRCTALKCEDI